MKHSKNTLVKSYRIINGNVHQEWIEFNAEVNDIEALRKELIIKHKCKTIDFLYYER